MIRTGLPTQHWLTSEDAVLATVLEELGADRNSADDDDDPEGLMPDGQ